MNQSSNPLIATDYVIIAGFFAVMLAVGFYFAGRMHNVKDYFAGGKQVPWWLSSVSYWMSSFSAFAFVAHSSLAYRFGVLPVTFWWLSAPAMIICAHLVAARWRRVATTSPMEFIEERYGIVMRQALSWLGTVLVILDDGLKVVAIGMVVSASLGFDVYVAIISCGLIMLTYTLLGGLWAVLITDFVQFIVMMAAVIVLVPLAIARVGGVDSFFAQLPDGFFSPTEPEKYNWGYLVSLVILCFLGYCTRWSLVQRFYSVKSDADARKVCYLVAGLNVLVAPMLLFPAMAASVFLPGVEDPDRIYGLLCKELLPAGMLGMLIAAIFSATMSSLSSDYNAIASVLTTDVYKRLFAPSASERTSILAGRIFTLLVGLITIGIALSFVIFGKEKTLFDLMIIVFALLGPSTTIPVVAGLVSKRVSGAGALCATITGIVVSFTARFAGPALLCLVDPFVHRWLGFSVATDAISERTLMIIGITSTFAGLIVGSILMPGTSEKRRKVARFLDGVTARERGPEPAAPPPGAAVSPAPMIGVAVSTLGALLLVVVLATVPVAQAAWSLGVGAAMLAVGIALILVPRLTRSRGE